MQALPGKVAVVTGAASGIGLALARRFGADGMQVVMADIERPTLEREAATLADEGIDVLTVIADTSIEGDVEALAEATLEHFGGVHLVCNNAGVGSRGLKIADLPAPRLRMGDRRQPVGGHQRHARLPPPPPGPGRGPHRQHGVGVRHCTTILGWARTTPPRRRWWR